jgi:hypothetical protein
MRGLRGKTTGPSGERDAGDRGAKDAQIGVVAKFYGAGVAFWPALAIQTR